MMSTLCARWVDPYITSKDAKPTCSRRQSICHYSAKIMIDFSCKSSADLFIYLLSEKDKAWHYCRQTIYMKCQALFSLKEDTH